MRGLADYRTAVLQLYNPPQLRAEMGQRARAWAREQAGFEIYRRNFGGLFGELAPLVR